MKDTSETPEGTEQAKAPQAARPRTPARAKSESSTSVSAEQDSRPAPRRRTASTPPTGSNGNEGAATPRASETEPREQGPSQPREPREQGPSQPREPREQGPSQPREPREQGPSQPREPREQGPSNAQGPVTHPEQGQGQGPRNNPSGGSRYGSTSSPRPAGGPDGAPPQRYNNNPDGAPPQRFNNNPDGAPPQRFNNNPDGAPPQRYNNNPGGAPPQRYNNNPGGAPPQRFNNNPGGAPPQRFNNNPGGAPPQRFNNNPGGAPPQRYNNNPGGAPPQRYNNNPGGAPPQRFNNNPGGAPAPRFNNTAGTSTPHAPYQRDGQRGAPRSGGSSAPSSRPASSGRPSSPSGQRRPGGGRPSTSSQRPQERRANTLKEKVTGPVQIPPQIVVKDLADLLHVTASEIIRGLITHGIFANINEVVEYEKSSLVAQELGFEPSQSVVTSTATQKGERKLSANEEMMASRNDDGTVVIPPVVTIMGHVDHGKTSLLDTIRKTKVAAGEAGGITQHIGAYQVEVNGKKITFLDTPGHEAFTAMRARGAQVTHIAIIVVAADDGVMPQTREAIDHAQAAKVPIIIALNKIDKANANPDRVKQQLTEIGIVIEEYGGETVCVPVSARRGTGIDELLEYILLVAEVQDIRANPNRLATGVIIEARLEKNTGPMATVLVQQGTLKMGDNIVVGELSGKVRAMFNDRGKPIQKAPPSTPVSILGLPEVPQAGDHLEVAIDERTAKQQAQQEAEKRRDESMSLGQVSLDTLYMQMQEGKVKELNIVLKCDVQGSAEAIKNALSKVGEENIKVRLIHEGIGNISETDVHLAAASGAVIIGFNVKADGAAQRQAQKEGVDIRYYNVIYKLTDDIQAALSGMLEPTYREVVEGHAEVVQIFKAGKNVVIAGCRITDGKLTRSSQIRIMRKDEKVHEGKISSLRRGKDDVREVASGYECGIVLEDFTTFEIGDIVEAFTQERVKPGAH